VWGQRPRPSSGPGVLGRFPVSFPYFRQSYTPTTFEPLLSHQTGAQCWKRPQRRSPLQHQNLWAKSSGAERGAIMNFEEAADHEKNPLPAPQKNDAQDEARRIRRLQVMMSMVSSVISQDPSLTVEQASELAAGAKRAALAMFPDKELAYDILYKPRLQRLMRERFRLQ
jgi:hypothetical protein